jgi:hypothetical protein
MGVFPLEDDITEYSCMTSGGPALSHYTMNHSVHTLQPSLPTVGLDRCAPQRTPAKVGPSSGSKSTTTFSQVSKTQQSLVVSETPAMQQHAELLAIN